MALAKLSQSAITSWEFCRAKFYAEYILGLKLSDNDPNLWYGRHVHKQVENYHLGHDYDADIVRRYAEVYPSPAFVSVEQRFSFQPALLDIPFNGVIDRVAATGLHDVKTSTGSWSQRRADESIQATSYLAYWHHATGELVPFTFDVLRKDQRTNGEAFPLQSVTTHRTLDQLKAWQYQVAKLVHDINQEYIFACSCSSQEHAIWSRQELPV